MNFSNWRTLIKYIFLLIIFVLFIVFLMFYFKNKIVEKNEDEYTKKISLFNWWNSPDYKGIIVFFKNFFSYGVLNKYDKIEIYSVFGEVKFERQPNTLYVQFSGESYYNDPSIFDVNLIPAESKDDNNVVSFPYMYFNILTSNIDMELLKTKRVLDQETFNKKKKFCLFSVKNSNSWVRNQFYEKLSKYKQVTSCRDIEESDEPCPPLLSFNSPEYFEYISKFKFMICFENKSEPYYLTEKLVNAYYGGAIPIYWGCTNVNEYIDMNCMLYLKREYTEPGFTEYQVDKLIKEIIRLDNDDELYKEKYENSFFRDGIIPDEFNIEKIKEKIDYIALYKL
jgi:hypothetical protein